MKSIKIGNIIGQSIEQFFSKTNYSQIGLLCDENTLRDCFPLIMNDLPKLWIIEIKSGEENKNLQTCEQIWTALTKGNFDRNSLLINLGGGVICDMGGFVASTFKRGLDFINIPTTLLSQVDASVGGKLGIDFMELKNHIGVFREPDGVFIDTIFLKTLPKNKLRSGFAEIIKHGLIADISYWKEIKKFDFNNDNWNKLVSKSVLIKYNIVQKDFLESGFRKVLNFGHTIGHGIESVYLNVEKSRLLHGEAIAIGMICESYLATKLTGLPKEQLEEIIIYILRVFDLITIDKSYFEQIIKLIYQDKKNKGNTINCSLLKTIGKCTFDIPVSEANILDSLFYYNRKAGNIATSISNE